jgi:hypothetical protein
VDDEAAVATTEVVKSIDGPGPSLIDYPLVTDEMIAAQIKEEEQKAAASREAATLGREARELGGAPGPQGAENLKESSQSSQSSQSSKHSKDTEKSRDLDKGETWGKPKSENNKSPKDAEPPENLDKKTPAPPRPSGPKMR